MRALILSRKLRECKRNDSACWIINSAIIAISNTHGRKKISASVIELLCSLFKFDYKHFYDEKKLEILRAFYQIIAYGMNNGKKKMLFKCWLLKWCSIHVVVKYWPQHWIIRKWQSIIISYYGAVITWFRLCWATKIIMKTYQYQVILD